MLTTEQIKFLNQVCPEKWTENNGKITVNAGFNVYDKNLTQIPIKFESIEGICHFQRNQLTMLPDCPVQLDDFFSCSNNQLTNLQGAPEICNDVFYCNSNQLTSLQGCPRLINNDFECKNNPNLHILYGIGRIDGGIYYDNMNDLNEWIIEQARKDIFSTYADIAKWIKDNNKLEYLLYAQQEIRQYFSPRVLHLVDFGLY